MATYKTIPGWIKETLVAGEHVLVDYKESIPGELGKVIAGGANSVAVRGSDKPFLILIGVKEIKHPNGHRSGRPKGIVDSKTGQHADLDLVELQAMSKAKSVVPIPEIDVHRVATGTSRPFLVLEIRPSDPPHRFEDRYPIRRGSQSQPLEAAQLDELFFRKRVRTVLGELEDDNPMARVLSLLSSNVFALSSEMAVLAADTAGEAGVAAGIENAVREVREVAEAIRESAAAIAIRVEESADLIERELTGVEPDSVWSVLDEVRRNTRSATMEEVFVSLLEYRRVGWRRVNQLLARRGADEVGLGCSVSRLMESRFFHRPSPLDFEANRAELNGWRLLHAAGNPAVSRSDAELHSLGWRACWASVARAVAQSEQADWLDLDRELVHFDFATLTTLIDEGEDLPSSPRGELEAAVVLCDPDRLRSALQASGACFTRPDSDAIGWMLSGHQVLFSVTDSETSAVVSIPVSSSGRVDSAEEIRRLRRRLRRSGELEIVRCVPAKAGLLGTLAGVAR